MAYVASNGDIYPCSNTMSDQEYRAGNIQTVTFPEVWEHGFRDYRAIHYEDFAGCAKCPVQERGIWCQFRCPSLSRNVHGDPQVCGATDYIKQFMLLCDNYWKERETKGMRLRL